ncbi:MAG: hypothetical protein E6G13_01580 [Actinobacteria bacterium]|nr:MAG: hypothetical protein E6G13_01580 [Actinomycetota bacterium]
MPLPPCTRASRSARGSRPARRSAGIVVALATVAFVCASAASAGSGPKPTALARIAKHGDDPTGNVNHDVSPPLRTLAPAPDQSGKEKKEKEPKKGLPVPAQSAADPVVQSSPGTAAAPAPGPGFDGIGQGFTGPSGSFFVGSAPPDPNGAAGPNHYVQIVNSDFAIFNKAGTPVYGPVPTNTLWSGFGGGCQTNNDGDATVEYDRLADRWIISQFSVSTTPYLQCVAVSTSGDPTGSYFRYSFQYNNFPDYPKLGVWPDGYYTTFNLFNASGTQFLGPEICSYDRAKMLLGQAATQQCFTLGSSFGGLLPSDLDGPTPPPAGAPDDVVSFATNSLQLWRFHVDWSNPASSALTGPTTLPVAAFSPACSGGGTCIPQAGTTQKLDSLADRLMYRLAYRNFGDHQSLVVNDSVTAGASVGIRWYELRDPNGTPTVYQQGTYAPDSSYRWMGSVAMDHNGDMALGFSVSSSALHPGIHYTGRLAGDPLGTMTAGETSLVDGAGSQTATLSRWGDYSSMSIDPSDDCTFWYTTEYIPANGTFNWHTRIGSFKFPSCGAASSDFSLSATPSALSVAQGGNGTSTVSTAITSGSAQTVALSASGQPTGVSVTFSPASVAAGASSTMTVSAGGAATPGTYPVTVTGTGSSATHTTTVNVTVTAPPTDDFSLAASPSSLSLTQGSSGTTSVSTSLTAGSAQTVSLSASGLPSGTTAAFNPASVSTGGSSTLTLTTGSSTPLGNYPITITGTGTSTTHTTTVTLTVTAPPDFSIASSPATLTISQGGSATSTISTAVTTGSAQPVSLSASGQPSGTTVGFNPTSMNAGGSSTLTVNVGSATAAGSYTLTITGTGTSATHTTTLGLTVTPAPGVANGGFETGDFSNWSASGVLVPHVVTTSAHGGTYAAQLGASTAYNGNSTLTQTIAVPTGTSQLTFWYQPHCPDTITYDQIQMQIRSTSGTTLATVLNACTNTGAWTSVAFDTSAYAGQTVVLWLNTHDDNYPSDPTYALFDDVAVVNYVPAPNVVQNPGFETGTLSPWTGSGAFFPVIASGGHTGTNAARIGSTSAVNGNSTLTQTVTVPTGSPSLTFWYQPHCPDTITYDQIQMQVRSTTGTTLATVLNVCNNSGTWTQASFGMAPYAGQTVVLWFNDHDDGYASDPTYFLLDDIALR